MNLKFDLSKKLILWLNTWFDRYLPEEKSFPYYSLMRYERGMVVKADLGFKVGSEEGGLHYALIIENDNSISNKTVTVIPLKSLEITEDINKEIYEQYEIFLGYGIFKNEIKRIQDQIHKNQNSIAICKINNQNYSELEKQNISLTKKLANYQKGSIALVGQICALSKMRIHFPKNVGDELSDFKLDSRKLNEIDRKIKQLYLKKSLIKSSIEKAKSILKK